MNTKRIQEIQQETANALFKFFDELESEWKPKTGISEQITPNHGSSTGELETKKVYWDEYRSNWTSHKPTAFEGFVLKRIRRLFNEWERNKKNNTEA